LTRPALAPRLRGALSRWRWALAVLAAIAALALALLTWAGWTLRERILAEAEREISTQADIVGTATQRRLQSLRFALAGLPGWIDGPILASGIAEEDVHEVLKNLLQAGGTGVGFIAVAPDGTVVASARAAPGEEVQIGQRAAPNLATLSPATRSGLAISAAFISGPEHIPGRPIVAVSRALPAGGWVQALVPVDAPFGLLPAADLGEGSAAWLVREDGKGIARWPLPMPLPGPSFYETPLFQTLLPSAPEGLSNGPCPFGGPEAIAAWRSLPEFGLVLVVRRDRAAILAPWRAGMATILGALGLALVAAGLLAWRGARAAAALSHSEDRVAMMTDTLGLLLWTRPTRLGRATYYGNAAERLSGYAKELLTSRPRMWRDLVIHPDDRARVSEEYASADLSKLLSQTYRIVRADGEVRWVSGLIREAPWGGVVGVIQDITALHEAQARLARSEAELAEAMRIAGLGRWQLDPATGRLELSEEIFAQMGVDPARFEPTLASMRALVLAEDWPILEDALRRLEEQDGPVEFEYRLRRPDGALRHRWARAAREGDGARASIVGVCQDITDRREAAAQLAHASRMAALGQLTGGIAHDVNNMLTVVSLNLDLLADEIAPGTPAAEALEAARRAAAGGSGLTAQLLAFARRQPLRPEVVGVAALFDELRPMLARTLGRGVTVTLEAAPGTGAVRVDAAQLRSALVNLAINARDAMPEGGTVTITAAPAEAGSVAFAVADTGLGMPPEVAARAFEPFFTTKPSGKGTGLGLAQVYGFITQSHGTIGIESQPGKGTVVRFTLPVAAPEAGAAEGEAASPRRGARVLVVEDETELRLAVAAMCRSAGFAVVEAENAAAAMALIEAGLRPDLLFTDVSLGPGPDGVALAALASRRVPGLRVLFATGFTAEAEVPEGAPLLRKPYARQALLAALAAALEREGATLPDAATA
jgi:PAS domain S-box-containing protein